MIGKKNYSGILYPIIFDGDMTIFYPCSELSFVSNADIKDIVNLKLGASSVVIYKQEKDVKIAMTLAKEKLLTFSESYDTFKAQKGSSNT